MDLQPLWPQKGAPVMQLLAFFPLNQFVFPGNPGTLLRVLLAYLVGGGVIGFILHLAGYLPFFGILAWMLRVVIGLYCLVGFILAILQYCDVLR